MGLSETQSRAVAHGEGPCMCLAGPGSGKTTVITQRTKYLIEELKVMPREILVITFTKAAALEMKERFYALMGGIKLPVTFGTFHAVFFTILRQAYHLTAGNILKEEQKYQYLKEIVSHLKMEIEDESEFTSDLASEISLVKNERIPLEHYYSNSCPEEIFRDIFRAYKEKVSRARLLDFDDILVYTYELLKERPDICSSWQKCFRYILIDEFQDINKIQYDVIKLLAAPANNLFIVGDDDQSIYRFRGAKPEIMLNFPKEYPGCKIVALEENYRSAENIIKAAGRVISNNTSRFPKKIHGVKGPGDKLELHGFVNQTQENIFLIKRIQEYLKQGETYRNMAVLFRTNTGARTIVEKFMEYNIPFQMRDVMPNIYDHWITKDIAAYFRIAMGERKRQDFLRIINRPKRYIGRETLDEPTVSFDKLCKYYEDKQWMVERIDQMEYNIKLISKMTPYAAINYIRHGIGYEEYLKEYAVYRKIKPEDLYEVLDELSEAAKAFRTFEDWFAHMEEYTKALREQAGSIDPEADAVLFTTLHSSKGLEFKIVFIIDINEGVIPHRKAVLDMDVQEERRMFYVGMTRAKEKLHLYYVKERYGKPMDPSRFLEELRRTGNK